MNALPTLESRVRNSLLRLGYRNIFVTHVRPGVLKLSGTVASQNDRAIIRAAARTVVGVHGVIVDVRVQDERNVT